MLVTVAIPDNIDMRLPLGRTMNIDPKIVQELVNFVSRSNGYGNQDESLFNIMWGLNNLNPGFNLPYNTERYGYIFLTRPDLNLSYNNICDHPYLSYLLDSREESVLRAIRIMLDGDSWDKATPGTKENTYPQYLKSRSFNRKSPFLNIITNSAISCSGWRDISMDTYTSREGRRKESWSIADGVTEFMGQSQFSISCRSLPGDVILRMHELWLHYMSSVMRGTIFPKPVNLWQGRIDYNTRIFRIITDVGRRNIIRLSSSGPGFPLNAPTGAAANFAIDTPFNAENDQVTINFMCNGERHNHMGIADDFNACVAMRNPAMSAYLPVSDTVSIPSKNYRLLTTPEVVSNIFNYYATPLINPEYMELEWWIENEHYNRLAEMSSDNNLDQLMKEATDSLNKPVNLSNPKEDFGYYEQITQTRDNSLQGDQVNA